MLQPRHLLRCRVSITLHNAPRIHQSVRCFVTQKTGKSNTVLTEYVYGRTRIYTNLQTMAKGKPATSGKTRIGSPVTSPPLSWKWLQTSENKVASSSTEIGGDKSEQNNQVHILGSLKQSMREMFLPVGYPESVHSCYKKFHMWLALETYVGSAVSFVYFVVRSANSAAVK
ncbi:hypothetical protein BJV82DRAFT_604248 [Fennellomyces sp. T-0311]|nr:hypothetical protein BJV82DRAFT_604248 [Fennellomyces sp. T-0311]